MKVPPSEGFSCRFGSCFLKVQTGIEDKKSSSKIFGRAQMMGMALGWVALHLTGFCGLQMPVDDDAAWRALGINENL